jgi:hypothetical protein
MKKSIITIALLAFLPTVIFGQETQTEPTVQEAPKKVLTIHGELKAHYRWSKDAMFPLRFPFPPEFIPRGQTQVFLRTVSPGSAFEISQASVILDLEMSPSVTGRIRVQFIDLYNRNPTSTDHNVNVKEAWLLLGKRTEFLQDVDGSHLYALFGKAPKFERQRERNMESYGLVSTAFNRLEDIQLQIGGNVSNHFYFKAQISSGNPVFFRDTNALAGDNGTDDLRLPNPEPNLNSGFPIIYDAEVEDVSSENLEGGGGIGFRIQSESAESGIDFLAFYYHRTLAERKALNGTFYGGDIDLLDGTGGIGLPISGRDKEEYGGNIEARYKSLHIFFQGVHQEVAGLKRNGYEVEAAWNAPLPLHFATGGKQLFTFVQPVVRFSMLNNDFRGSPFFVAPTMFWDWKKYDFGVRIGIVSGIDFTAEYSTHDIEAPRNIDLDEFLTTLRARF